MRIALICVFVDFYFLFFKLPISGLHNNAVIIITRGGRNPFEIIL